MSIPKWILPKNAKDVMHYLIVFAILAYVWVPLMSNFDLNATLLLGFGVFYLTDKVAHAFLHVD